MTFNNLKNTIRRGQSNTFSRIFKTIRPIRRESLLFVLSKFWDFYQIKEIWFLANFGFFVYRTLVPIIARTLLELVGGLLRECHLAVKQHKRNVALEVTFPTKRCAQKSGAASVRTRSKISPHKYAAKYLRPNGVFFPVFVCKCVAWRSRFLLKRLTIAVNCWKSFAAKSLLSPGSLFTHIWKEEGFHIV
jgi:hypothetical protein